jgi:hypothetical protein
MQESTTLYVDVDRILMTTDPATISYNLKVINEKIEPGFSKNLIESEGNYFVSIVGRFLLLSTLDNERKFINMLFIDARNDIKFLDTTLSMCQPSDDFINQVKQKFLELAPTYKTNYDKVILVVGKPPAN